MLNIPLKQVMTKGYLYVEEDDYSGKALGIMRDMHFSCVFVLKRDKPKGIITERRIMENALRHKDISTLPVTNIMSGPLLALNVNDTIERACEFMTEKEVRHIGVLDDNGFLKGTLTPSNIINILGSESFSSTALVKDVMYPNHVLATPEIILEDAALKIIESGTCCIIVMEGEYPVGLVSEKDIVRCVSFGQNLKSMTLQKVMSSPVISIDENDSIAQAIITLRRKRIHRVLVFNKEGRVSGILANNSLVRNIKKIVVH